MASGTSYNIMGACRSSLKKRHCLKHHVYMCSRLPIGEDIPYLRAGKAKLSELLDMYPDSLFCS